MTVIERVSEESLETFLAAANVWLIPYRRDFAGVSVPSRFYNLLAIGRPVILVSEANAEAALTVSEHDLGWVVEPGDPDRLAQTIRLAALREDSARAERAAIIAQQFNFAAAMNSYVALMQRLIKGG